METVASFQDFRSQWLEDVVAGSPSTTELGHRFARKLITQWLDVFEDSDDLIYCDGAGDGGIDIAYLERGENGDGDSLKGDTWYLVQSKYGAASQGKLLEEAQKVLDTLDGQRTRLSSLSESLLARLVTFRGQASERDHIILVFATEKALNDSQKRAIESIKAMGSKQLGALFDVEAVSIETIYQRLVERANASAVRVTIKAQFTPSGNDLLVGPISLTRLYEFLKEYRAKTGDLDRLYEKNVRRFLGSRSRVNKAMKQTLEQRPDQFGLYNNGITIVVADFQQNGHEAILHDPSIVNGCQTTRTIWEVCHPRLEAGGTGHNVAHDTWRKKVDQGVLVAKIVKVRAGDEEALEKITRYTNSQNAMREKDFVALTQDFKTWAQHMEERYRVYLEIQRGGWDSRRALQQQHPTLQPQFKEHEHANAFDLIKVYGAGWLREAGDAFGRNAPFLPNGVVFKELLADQGSNDSFGVDDLYAAYCLQTASEPYEFGRRAKKSTRLQTRFLFYMIVVDLLRDVIARAGVHTTPTRKDMTRAMLKLFQPANEGALRALLDAAINVVDDYLNPGIEESVFQEPAFQERNNDLNTFLKWGEVGKNEQTTPQLHQLLQVHTRLFGRGSPGQNSPRELVIAAIAS